MDVRAILDTWRQVLTVDFLRYFLAAAPFYLVFWIWRPSWSRARRLQNSDPERAQVLSEIAYSMSTVVIFSAVGMGLLYAQRAGLTRIYLSIPERGWAYLGASIAVAVLLHDAYFYWSHRLLHWRPFFRFAHHVHHRSTSPTPWAAYAFHPIEALVQAGVYVLVVFTLPMHPLALGLFLVHMILRNVIGHLGFEIWPAGFARSPLTRWHLTPTHHDLHHRFGKGNYGFYFGFWDDWCGTSRTDYADAYDGVTAKRCSLRRPTAVTIGLLLCVGALAGTTQVQAGEPSPVEPSSSAHGSTRWPGAACRSRESALPAETSLGVGLECHGFREYTSGITKNRTRRYLPLRDPSHSRKGRRS